MRSSIPLLALILFGCAVMTFAGPAGGQADEPRPEFADAVDTYITEVMDRFNVPGLTVAKNDGAGNRAGAAGPCRPALSPSHIDLMTLDKGE